MTAPKPPSKKATPKRPSRATPAVTDQEQNPPSKETPPRLGIGPVKPTGGRPKKGAEVAHLEARRAIVEKCELDGMSLRAIAEVVEVDKHVVSEDLKVIRAARREAAAGVDLETHRDIELRRLEDARLDLMTELEGVADHMSGEKRPRLVKAVDDRVRIHRELLKIAGRKAKLLGLDAPQHVKLSGEVRSQLALGLDTAGLADLLTGGAGLDDVDG